MPLDWTKAPLTQGFGPTDEPLDSGYNGYAHFNKGLDYGVPVGTSIDSPVSGTVIAAGDQGDGWGTSVKIRAADGSIHNFGHLSGVNVSPGQQVNAGTIVGKSGNTGASTGPHISYDVQNPSGQFVDPSSYLKGGGGPVANPRSVLDPRATKTWGGRELGASDSTPDSSGIDLGSFLNGSGGANTSTSVNTSYNGNFFDVNRLDQDSFDAQQKQQQWQNDFDQSQFNYQKAQDDRDYALAVGDLDLAKQKQASADFWEGKGLEVQQAMNASDNARALQVAQIDAQSQIQAASIAADSARYAAQTRLQADLANAHNDEERNRIALVHEQEMAQIARMEDDSKRQIAARQSQIDSFNAESTRQYNQGQLALENNKFLLDKASSPRDLPGLFMLQRGITPDWDALKNGQVAQGDPLKPVDPMKAYVPQGTLPTNFAINPTPGFSNVGTAAQGLHLNANPYMGMNQVAPPSTGGGGSSGSFGMGAMPASTYNPSDYKVNVGGPRQLTPTPTDINPGGMQGGIPMAGLKPGQLNLSTWGGQDGTGSELNLPAYYDQGMTRQVQPTDVIQKGTQLWVDYGIGGNGVQGNPVQGQPNSAGAYINGQFFPGPVQQSTVSVQRNARGSQGFTTATNIMAGDSMAKDPYSGGAKPELIQNPTGAPLRVMNTNQTAQAMFGPGQTNPFHSVDYGVPAPQQGNPQQGWPQMGFPQIDMNHLLSMIQQHQGASRRAGGGGPGFSNGFVPSEYRYGGGQGIQTTEGINMGPNSVWGGDGNLDNLRGTFGFYPGQPQVSTVTKNPQPMQQQYQQPAPQQAMPFHEYQQTQPQMQGVTGPAPMGSPQASPNYQQIVSGIGSGQYNIAPDPYMNMGAQSNQMNYRYPVRFATGTDVSQDYVNAGMGGQYIYGSNNQYLQGQNLPPALQMLADYGYPINPSLSSSVMGSNAPTLNVANAFNQRGGGMLPSLQTIGNQTQSETDALYGYSQGPVGIPFADVMDFIGMPTKNLRTAQRGRLG